MKVLSPVTTSESLWAFAVQKWQGPLSISHSLHCYGPVRKWGAHFAHTFLTPSSSFIYVHAYEAPHAPFMRF